MRNNLNKKESNIQMTKSPFNITVEDIRVATTRYQKEGSRAMVGNRKGIAGISLLKNKYHMAITQAIEIVASSKK